MHVFGDDVDVVLRMIEDVTACDGCDDDVDDNDDIQPLYRFCDAAVVVTLNVVSLLSLYGCCDVVVI